MREDSGESNPSNDLVDGFSRTLQPPYHSRE
ncbi:hypothetical protein CCACVL1_01012, partial [Corchorus capsularis]